MFYLLSILFIAAILRLYNLTAMSLWHDEAFSALLVKYNFGEMMYRIALDVHPPFYYLVLRSWDFFLGNSLFSLRMFSLIFSLLTLLGVYLLIKEFFKDERLALFASLLVAVNPFQIQYAQEARMYTLGTFLIVFSSYFLLKAIRPTGENKKVWFYWILYILSASAAIYTHYYVFFSIFAQVLFVFFIVLKESKFNPVNFIKNKNFKFGLAAYFFIALSYLPWLKTFLKQTGQVQESYWIPQMDIWSIPNTFWKMTTGLSIDSSKFKYILIGLMIAVLLAVVFFLKEKKQPAKWLIFLSLAVPFLAASVFSLKTSVYLDRYFIFVSAFYLIFIAGGILLIKNRFVRKSIALFLILGSLSAFACNWNYLDAKNKSGMAGTAGYLNQEVKPGDKIFVGSSFIYFTFRYYNKTPAQPKLYAPGELSHFSGTALLSEEDIIKDFSQEVEKEETVWLLNTTGFGNWQPEVPSNWQKIEEKGFQDIYDYRGWIVVSKYRI
jgi:mannosyltransferase